MYFLLLVMNMTFFFKVIDTGTYAHTQKLWSISVPQVRGVVCVTYITLTQNNLRLNGRSLRYSVGVSSYSSKYPRVIAHYLEVHDYKNFC